MRQIYLLLVGFESNDFCGHIAEEELIQRFIKLGSNYTKLYSLHDPFIMGVLEMYLKEVVAYEKDNIPLLTLHLYVNKWDKLFKLLLRTWDENAYTRLHLIHLQQDESISDLKEYTIENVIQDIQRYLAGGAMLNITHLPFFMNKDTLEKIHSLHKIKRSALKLSVLAINQQITLEYNNAKQELVKNPLLLLFKKLKNEFYYSSNALLLEAFIYAPQVGTVVKYFDPYLLAKLKCRINEGSLLFELTWPLHLFATNEEVHRLACIQKCMQLLYSTNLEMRSRFHAIRNNKSAKAHYFIAKHILQSLMNAMNYCNKDELILAEVSQFFLKLKQICEIIQQFLVAIDFALVPSDDILLNAKRLVENQNDLLVLRQAEMTKFMDDSYHLFVKESQVDVVRQSLIFYDFNHFFLMNH